jgi:hypothetical protein
MNHLSEEELIAHAYAEDDNNAVQQHLQACAECAKAYSGLGSDMADMKFAEAPTRDAAYGHRVWESIADSLPAYESRKSWFRGGLWPTLGYAVAGMVVVVSAFLGGRLWEHRHAQTVAQSHPQQHEQSVAKPTQRVLVVVLSDHLDRSERLLVELNHADADNGKLASPLRDEARSLLPANRICRQNAKQDDDRALSSALDRLDRLLLELANQPEGLSSQTISRLQDEMNADGLLFEVRVLRSRQAASSTHAKGDTI